MADMVGCAPTPEQPGGAAGDGHDDHGGSDPGTRTRHSRAPSILLIDGDEASRKVIGESLRRAGYEVRTAQSGRDGLDRARINIPDLVILEAALPGRLDGFDTCRLLRQQAECPVIFVSSRATEIDRVVGLEVGADDYVSKPFSMRELLARVAAHLRRAAMPVLGARDDDRADGASTDTGSADALPDDLPGTGEANPRPRKGYSDPDILVFEGVTVDAVRREVRTSHRRVSLKRREFDLLLHLARNHGIVLSRSQLLRAVWPEEFLDHETRTVDVHVSRVRDKVETDPAHPRFIHTVRGTGYQFRVIPPSLAKKKEKHK